MQQTQYRNIAFISYKREDEDWAKWLQKKLEHYKLPTEIRKKNPTLEFSEIPRHVFKDTTDLSGGVLAKAIKAGLDSSKFLIVICSPRAAKSEWVCKEVQNFIDSGREEYIIPFIIEGEPHSNDVDKECFPEALRSLAGERELLGININENGRDAAAVKIIARMFDLQYDALWNRFKREEFRKRRNTIGAFIFAIIVLLSIIAYGMWANKKISSTNKQLLSANNEISKQKKNLQNANDNIIKQKTTLQEAFNNLYKAEIALSKSNASLRESNKHLKEERDNVIKANWKMMENQALAVSEKAVKLISNGNTIKGSFLAFSIIPKKRQSPIRPFVESSEQAIRAAYDSIFYGRGTFTILEQKAQILDTSFSRDDKYILTTSNDGKVRIWETNTGQEKLSFECGQSILSARFFKDNTILSFLYDGSVSMWDMEGKKKNFIYDVLGENPRFSKDDTYLALQQKNKNITNLWNTNTWKIVRSIPTTKIAFSPNKDQFAYIDRSDVVIYGNNRILNKWHCIDSKIVYSLEYSADGTMLLICTNDTLSLWDISKGKKIFSKYETEGFNGAIFSYDDRYIITQSETGKVNFYSIHDVEKTKFVFQYPSSVERIEYSPKGKYFSVFNYGEGFVNLYKDPITQKNKTNIMELYHTNNDIYMSNNGLNFMILNNDMIELHNINNNNIQLFSNPFVKKIKNKNNKEFYLNMISSISYSTKSECMAILSKEDKKIHIFHGKDFCEWYSLPINSQVFYCTFSKDGKFLAVGCRNKAIYVWDVLKNKKIATLLGHKLGVTALDFSNDNKTLMSASYDNTIRFWNINKSEEYLKLRDANNYDIKSVTFDNTGSYYAYADETAIHVKKTRTNHEIYTININDASYIAFSDNNDLYVLRGNYDDYDYDGNHIVRCIIPQWDEIYSYFKKKLVNYRLTEDERRNCYLK